MHAHQLGGICNQLEEMEEMRVCLNQQEGLITDLSVHLVRVERRARRRHEREMESCSSPLGSSYGPFCGQVWSGEGFAENPIMEREVVIHVLVLEENKEPVLVPEPGPSCRPLVERIGRRELVEWDSGEDLSGAECHQEERRIASIVLISWRSGIWRGWRRRWLLHHMGLLCMRKVLLPCNFVFLLCNSSFVCI